MRKILLVNACVRPKSRTLRLVQKVLSGMDGVVEEVNLEKENIQALNWETLKKRDACVEREDFSDEMFRYAEQFKEADEIVIAAPYWDFSFPAMVRTYIEAVTVCGLTFYYTSEGVPTGLCKAQGITYVTTAGGTIGKYHLGYDLIKALAVEFFEIPKVTCHQAENLDIIGTDAEAILQKAMDEI